MRIYLAIKVTAFGIHLQGNKKFYIVGSLFSEYINQIQKNKPL